MWSETRIIMGMPIALAFADPPPEGLMDGVFAYFESVDARFSPFKADSEISALNRGGGACEGHSAEMREVLAIAARTKYETRGFFDIRRPDGTLDPSGIVKGWAVRNAARLVSEAGVENYCVDAGGDIQPGGSNAEGQDWRIGIRNPFNEREIIKVIAPGTCGVATSGNYARGQHIYNPHRPDRPIDEIVSLTVIGGDVLEADRFATAAFAMGAEGIAFIEKQPGLEGYQVSAAGVATQTRGFGAYVVP